MIQWVLGNKRPHGKPSCKMLDHWLIYIGIEHKQIHATKQLRVDKKNQHVKPRKDWRDDEFHTLAYAISPGGSYEYALKVGEELLGMALAVSQAVQWKAPANLELSKVDFDLNINILTNGEKV